MLPVNGGGAWREYDLRGVRVRFPYDAYDCQLKYMAAVIQSLQEVRKTD
jgi:hypothetical protein